MALKTRAEILIDILNDGELMELSRATIEEHLITARDARFSTPFRGNGLVIREKDGKASSVIRFGPETAVRLAFSAIAERLREIDGAPSRS